MVFYFEKKYCQVSGEIFEITVHPKKHFKVVSSFMINTTPVDGQTSGPRFNIRMSSYQYRKSHCGDKTVVRSSYLHNGIFYAGKMTSLYFFNQGPAGTVMIAFTTVNSENVLKIFK